MIFSDNPKVEKYRAVEDASPYRCGGIVFIFAEQCNNQGLFLRRANSVRPYRFVAVGFVFQPFIFDFQVTFGV